MSLLPPPPPPLPTCAMSCWRASLISSAIAISSSWTDNFPSGSSSRSICCDKGVRGGVCPDSSSASSSVGFDCSSSSLEYFGASRISESPRGICSSSQRIKSCSSFPCLALGLYRLLQNRVWQKNGVPCEKCTSRCDPKWYRCTAVLQFDPGIASCIVAVFIRLPPLS